MSDSSIQKNLGAYNTLWDGEPVRVDRKTSESFTVRAARLTLSIQVQEEPLREFIGRSQGLARNSGFLVRCLITHPESKKGSRMYQKPLEHWPALFKHQELINGLLNHDRTPGEKPTRCILRFDKEAQELWVKFHDAIEHELRPNGEYEAISDLASKLADNIARIAALFQIAMDAPGDVGKVGVQATQGATAVAKWHLDEALQFLRSASMPEAMRDADSILAWMDRNKLNFITKRDLQRNVTPGEIRHKDRFNAALNELEDQGDIRIEKKDNKLIVNRF